MSYELRVLPVTDFMQNCSILMCTATRKAVVIDPGGSVDHIIQILADMQAELEVIWITHGHLDHCSGAYELRRKTQVAIHGPHQDDAFWIDQLPQVCANYGFPAAQSFTPERWLQHDDTVSVGELSFKVVHCPGHTPGHVVFVNTDLRIAFVGDVLFKGGIGRTDFPRSNTQDLLDSIRDKLWPLGDDISFLSGHGEPSTFGHERATNPYLNNPLFG